MNDCWRQASPQAQARWLTYLATTGYTLSAIEQTVIDNAAKADSDDDNEGEAATKTGTEDPPAHEAA